LIEVCPLLIIIQHGDTPRDTTQGCLLGLWPNFLILDEGRDEEQDIYVVNGVYGHAGKPLKVVFTTRCSPI